MDIGLIALATSQAGYVGHEQVAEAGLTESGIRWWVKTGLLVPERKGLYRVRGITGDYSGLLRGAMAILPNPTISHESAAEVHAMPLAPRGLAVVTVHASTTHDFPGVKIHRSIDMFPEHRLTIGGRATTTPARTLVDLAAVLHPRLMAEVLDESVAARIASLDAVEAVLSDVARRGRTGCAVTRALLKERLGADVIEGTRLERIGMRVFEQGGLARPVFQYPAPWDPSRRIDFAWPWCRVGCECDSLRWHTRVKDFQTDRNRDNLALNHGWRVFRFTWEDFTKRPGMVVAQLRAALAA